MLLIKAKSLLCMVDFVNKIHVCAYVNTIWAKTLN